MSRDLRLYSLSLMLMLMLWTSSVHASYGTGSHCPIIAVPVYDNDSGIWSADDDFSSSDLRDIHPMSGTGASVYVAGDALNNEFAGCMLSLGAGTYYDGANHLWVLDNSTYCTNGDNYDLADFRAGTEY